MYYTLLYGEIRKSIILLYMVFAIMLQCFFSEWRDFVTSGAQRWLTQMVSWLVDTRPLFLMKYEDLKHNLIQTLTAAAKFLEMESSAEIINCTQKNSKGQFLRAKTQDQTALAVFTADDKKNLDKNIKIVNWYIERRCPHSPWCLSHAQVNFTGKPWTLPELKVIKPIIVKPNLTGKQSGL